MAVGSIVDYLKGKGQDSSYSARKKLAGQYGISNYSGTASQNTQLLKALQGQSRGTGAGTVQPAQSSQQNVSNGQNVTVVPVSSSKAGNPASEYITGYKYSRFSPSDRTQNYADILSDLEADKPGKYTSKYQGTIDNLIDSILNREEFNVDDVYNSDLYENYRQRYMQQGQKAMRDTIGQASQMTGGYGSTYAQAVGQQAYDNYMSQLGDKTLDIYDRVYNQYLQEGQELYNQLGMINNQDSIDYGRYRDTVNDYYNDLNYYAGRYDSSYGQDFGEYQSDLAAQQWAEEYAYQKTQDALAQQNWQTQFDYQKEQDALQYALQQQELALAYAKSRSGGGSSGGSSKKSSSSTDLSKPIADAERLLNAKDGHGLNYYGDYYVIEYIADKYPSLSDSQIKKVLTEAGGDYDKGLRTLKKITEDD